MSTTELFKSLEEGFNFEKKNDKKFNLLADIHLYVATISPKNVWSSKDNAFTAGRLQYLHSLVHPTMHKEQNLDTLTEKEAVGFHEKISKLESFIASNAMTTWKNSLYLSRIGK